MLLLFHLFDVVNLTSVSLVILISFCGFNLRATQANTMAKIAPAVRDVTEINVILAS